MASRARWELPGGHPPPGMHGEPRCAGHCPGTGSACRLRFYSPITCRLPVWLVGLSATPGSCPVLSMVGACVGTLARLPMPYHPWGRAHPRAAGSSRAAFPRCAACGHSVGPGVAGLATRRQPRLPLGPSLASQEAAACPRPPWMVTPPAWSLGAGKSCPEPLARLMMWGWGGQGGGVPIPAGTRHVPALAELSFGARSLARDQLGTTGCPGERVPQHRVLSPCASPRAPGEQLGAGQERRGGEALESSSQPGRPRPGHGRYGCP